MKNVQVALICAVILAGAVIVAASNVYLVRSLKDELTGRDREPMATSGASATAATPGRKPKDARQIVVAMMPKSKGNAYFIASPEGGRGGGQGGSASS